MGQRTKYKQNYGRSCRGDQEAKEGKAKQTKGDTTSNRPRRVHDGTATLELQFYWYSGTYDAPNLPVDLARGPHNVGSGSDAYGPVEAGNGASYVRNMDR